MLIRGYPIENIIYSQFPQFTPNNVQNDNNERMRMLLTAPFPPPFLLI